MLSFLPIDVRSLSQPRRSLHFSSATRRSTPKFVRRILGATMRIEHVAPPPSILDGSVGSVSLILGCACSTVLFRLFLVFCASFLSLDDLGSRSIAHEDVTRGIDVCRDHGWLRPFSPSRPVLVAVAAGGWIASTSFVSFSHASRVSPRCPFSFFLLLLFDGHVGGHVVRSWMSTRVRRREEWDGRHTPSTNEGCKTGGEEENTPEVLNGTTPKEGPPLPSL